MKSLNSNSMSSARVLLPSVHSLQNFRHSSVEYLESCLPIVPIYSVEIIKLGDNALPICKLIASAVLNKGDFNVTTHHLRFIYTFNFMGPLVKMRPRDFSNVIL